MNRLRDNRLAHYALLTAVLALMTLPNLGATSLWDMDEGVNAECSREMMETGTWIVPTFNYELRTAKPVMIYWLQRASYNLFGVSEWAARIPSVLASLGSVLLIYELGRRMFSPVVGLLGGVALATCIEFVMLAHAATPDAAFIFFTVLTLAAFWFGHLNQGRIWFVPAALAAGLATLTKGPAGLALPGLAILLYLAWNRELKRLLDRRMLSGIAVFLLVVLPWYGLVTAETRGAYIRAFIGNENVNRFLAPMENHRGPIFYYLGAIVVFFAPWSAVIGVTLWYGIRAAKRSPVELTDSVRAHRFLLAWVFTYLVFFSFAATKLPNYIAPLYPALSLLTANFLVRLADSSLSVPRWIMPAAIAGLLLAGIIVGLGLLIASGSLPIPAKGLRIFPGLAPWAAIGLVPVIGAAAIIALLRHQQRERAAIAFAAVAVAFVGLLAAFPASIVDAAKAPKSLVAESGARQLDRDIRLASLDYQQESITFYAERRVEILHTPDAALDFLALPRPGYLFLTAQKWAALAPQNVPYRIAARHFDFNRNEEIIVVTNEGVSP